MSRIPIVVGLDYHSQSVQVAIMRAGHKPELLANEKLPNDAAAIIEFVGRFGSVERCGIEACSGAANLAEELVTRVNWPVDLAHPGIASRMKHNPDKTDYADSQILADLSRVGYLPKVWLAPSSLRELRLVVHDRIGLARERRRIRQQIGALLREHRVSCASRRWSKPYLLWLGALELPAPSRFVLDRKLQRLKNVQSELLTIENYLRQITAEDPEVQKLSCQRGIGELTAWLLRAYVGSFRRFSSGKKLARYCGLSPRNSSSGQKQADSGLMAMANNDLRSGLIEVSWALIRHHPRWKKLSQLLRARGKPGSLVAAAIANRFIRELWRTMTREPAMAA